MRKSQKQSVLEIISTLYEAHKFVKKYIDEKEFDNSKGMMAECQNTAIELGEIIERSEGEECRTIKVIEEYCNLLYNEAQSIENSKDIEEALNKKLDELIKSINEDIKVRLEVVFLPYKASMWDSLESIWIAANEDENSDAYVVPIPYYDINKDGTLGEFHYEGREFPKEVPIIDYKSYNLEKRCPDVIYIHNPYDEYNTVTSVEPGFYSSELKKYTECLVYVPYYSTCGGMSQGQKYIPAYNNFDYIVTQAEKYKDFFDPVLTKENKLLPFGSPKFDRVINMCKNPPAPPIAWQEKMKDKKVYFYNTSIGEMLTNTIAFMKKMQYVFETFLNRKDVCLIWRPHPLFENSINSMRPQYKEIYFALKNFFIKNNIGIYDDTPDVTNTIALSDAYIGAEGSSVISLFGVVGKPIFILNNNINTLPSEDDWRGENVGNFTAEWLLTPQNKLYHSSGKNYNYKYFCSLPGYSWGGYYSGIFNIKDKTYITPVNAQDIIVINKNGIEKKISLEKRIEQIGAFSRAIPYGKYIFLIPNNYPAIVRYNTENDEVKYFEANLDVFIGVKNGERLVGGATVQNGYLFIASPINNQVLAINVESGKMQKLKTGAKGDYGCSELISDGKYLWFMPIWGNTVVSWDPLTGETREYSKWPEDFRSYHYIYKFECNDRPFCNVAFNEDFVYFSPCWGNMYIKLNRKTGEAVKWEPVINMPENIKNGYYTSYARSYFLKSDYYNLEDNKIFSNYNRKLYNVDFKNNNFNEIKIEIDVNELKENESGFSVSSEWLQYCCRENAFNSLTDFIDGKITGNAFNKEEQLKSYGTITANIDGTCGKKVHDFICSKFK